MKKKRTYWSLKEDIILTVLSYLHKIMIYGSDLWIICIYSYGSDLAIAGDHVSFNFMNI